VRADTEAVIRDRGERVQCAEARAVSLERSPQASNIHRRFTIADGLLLVIALGLGFAMVRQWTDPRWSMYPPNFIFGSSTYSTTRKIHHAVSVGISWTIPFAMTLSAMLLVARILPPRPSRTEIASMPGTIACAAAVIAILLRSSQEALSYLMEYFTLTTSPIHLPSPPFARRIGGPRVSVGEAIHNSLLEIFPFMTSVGVGAAVVVAWLLLWYAKLWRSQRDWVDRAGRVLGVYWIVVPAVMGLLSELWKWIG
jgi:hypothetical protein